MIENEENDKKIIEEKIQKFEPTLEKIDQKYSLLVPAVLKTKVAKLLDELDNLCYTDEELNETTQILFELIDDMAKDEIIQEISHEAEEKKKYIEKSGVVTGKDELLSIQDIKEGIEKLFNYLDNNTNIISSPRDYDERKKLYRSFKKGFRYIAEILKEQYMSEKTLETLELYGNLDLLANSPKHCAMRWNDTLSQLIMNFKSVILKRKDIEVEESDDLLVSKLKEIFFDARVIEVDKMCERFIKDVYGREVMFFGEGNVPHYSWIFKKEVNKILGLNVPLMDSKDSYIEYDGDISREISYEAIKYISEKDLIGVVFDRACQILSDKIKEDKKLCDAVIDWAGKYFDDNKFELVIKGGKSEFLQEYIFADVFSYQIAEFAIRELMIDKGFIQENNRLDVVNNFENTLRGLGVIHENETVDIINRFEDIIDRLQFESGEDRNNYSKNKKKIEKISRCLECMSRDGDRRIWDEMEKSEDFFDESLIKVWYKKAIREDKFIMFIKTISEDTFKNKYDSGYEFLKCSKNSVFAMGEVVYEIFNRGLIRYDDESAALMVARFLLMDTTNTTKDILTKFVKNINVNIKDHSGITPLIVVSRHGMAELATEILEKGVDVNWKDDSGCSAIHCAAMTDEVEVVKVLIENGANINDMENGGSLPLHWAVKNKSMEMLQLLLNNGADTNIVCEKLGFSPIHMAVLQNNFDIVEMLIEHGVDLNQNAKRGQNSLYLAVKEELFDMAKFLLKDKSKIDINAKDDGGKTALHVASSRRMLELLLENGADINAIDDEKGSVLHYAVEKGDINLVRFLLENGASVGIENKSGITPRKLAEETGDRTILFLLNLFKSSNRELPYPNI